MVVETETKASCCPLDCPDTCSLSVTVATAEQRVVNITGSQANPITGGYICRKVRHFHERMYGEDRILTPAVRRGAKGSREFVSVSWDEALSLIVERFQTIQAKHGAEAILPVCYGGSNGFLTQDSVDARFFRRLGAARLGRTICAMPTGRASFGMYGKMPGVALDDYVHARLIVLWGVNPSASGIHLVPYVRQAKQAGAKLVVIDPRRTPLAAQADLHLAPRPGGDLPMALGIAHWLFANHRHDAAFLANHGAEVEEFRRRVLGWTPAQAAAAAGVAQTDLETFAQWYADAAPALIRCGWGLERNRQGGSAVCAVLALPAIAGKFGIRGGGYTMSNSGAWTLNTNRAANEPEKNTRTINLTQLGEALFSAHPPLHALFVYNCNPVSTLPRQTRVRAGLMRADLFTVVFDQVWTDSARLADVVLPATTFLEHHELRRSYGAYALQQGTPVVAPLGESRPNYWVFQELCQRFGFSRTDDPQTPEELVEAVLTATDPPSARSKNGNHEDGDNSATSARQLPSENYRRYLAKGNAAPPPSGYHPVQFETVFPGTPDRKIHLVPEVLDREAPLGLYTLQPDPATDEYPLALISPADARTISSTLAELWREQVPVLIHPDEAAARGLEDGDYTRVFNDLGEVHCQVRRDDAIRRGVAVLPKGLWGRHTLNGNTTNALAPDTLTDLGAGACYNDARVQIAPLRRGTGDHANNDDGAA